jgi:hypothetical protein
LGITSTCTFRICGTCRRYRPMTAAGGAYIAFYVCDPTRRNATSRACALLLRFSRDDRSPMQPPHPPPCGPPSPPKEPVWQLGVAMFL